jgi:hypothetical protein
MAGSLTTGRPPGPPGSGPFGNWPSGQHGPSAAPYGGGPGGSGSPFPSPAGSRGTIRCAEIALWSTAHLYAGTDLAGQTYTLFMQPVGETDAHGRTLEMADTNVKEAGRVPAGIRFDVMRADWKIIPEEGDTEMEQLANAFGVSMVDQIRDQGVLEWDFLQTRIALGPLWLGGVSQAMSIPGDAHFKMLLTFGSRAPKLTLNHAIRVILLGRMATAIELG